MIDLNGIIEMLESSDQDRVAPIGFSHGHSYRGDYRLVAFDPKENVRVSEMLACARAMIGATLYGWKGGEYAVEPNEVCYIAEDGEAYADPISAALMKYICGKVS